MYKLLLTLFLPSLLLNATMLKIKKTGQDVSYNESGAVDITIRDDGYYQNGEEKSYSRTNEINISYDIVTDHVTGLQWEDNNDTDADGFSSNWQDAVAHCENSTFKGFHDWRLPSLKEIESIINYNSSNPAIDINASAFQYVASSYYWTSTPLPISPYIYSMGFIEGGSYAGDLPSLKLDVRCVRGTPIPDPDLSRHEDIVSDHATGLQWQDDTNASVITKTWEEAIDYCEAMTLGGYENWRLPNVRELISINNTTDNVLSSVFQNVSTSSEYWSSTTRTDLHSQALTHASIDEKTKLNHVRCVRNGQLAPGIVSIADQDIPAGAAFIVSAILKEGINPVTWSLIDPPNGMSINALTGRIVWKQTLKGDYTIKIQASNIYGSSTIEQFNLLVKEASEPLKKTKQTTVFSNFDDGDYQKGVEPNYSRSNGVVTDDITGLEWQDNILSPQYDYNGAINYCTALDLNHHTDWRVPNIEELETILYYGLMTDSYGAMISIDTNAFENAFGSTYWSVTQSNKVADTAWNINFGNGDDSITGIGNSMYVRCVRGETLKTPNLSRHESIVTDKRTGLQWDDNASVEFLTFNWENAIGYCEGLILDGLDDWRLPNVRELTSIIDHEEHALDPGFQEGLFTQNFWTSTTHPAFTSSAWYLDTNQYNATEVKTASSFHVRCVRGEPMLSSKQTAMPALIMYLLN